MKRAVPVSPCASRPSLPTLHSLRLQPPWPPTHGQGLFPQAIADAVRAANLIYLRAPVHVIIVGQARRRAARADEPGWLRASPAPASLC